MSQTIFDLLYAGTRFENGQLFVAEKVIAPNGRRTLKCNPLPTDQATFTKDATEWVDRFNYDYFKPAIMTGVESGHGSRDHASYVLAFPVDMDANKPGHPSREDVLSVLNEMDNPPTVIVNSDGEKGGFHCYWIFDSLIDVREDVAREDVQARMERWVNHLRTLLAVKPCTANKSVANGILVNSASATMTNAPAAPI